MYTNICTDIQQPRFEYRAMDGTTETVHLDNSVTMLGRGASCDLQLPSNRVSREHLLITCDEFGCHIEDLGSTNGTFLNGKRVNQASLMDGDLLMAADVELTFHNPSRDTQRRDNGRTES